VPSVLVFTQARLSEAMASWQDETLRELVQAEIARHWQMIRCVRVSDGRPRRRQALREYEIKGGVREFEAQSLKDWIPLP
jgi:hypothetical protein